MTNHIYGIHDPGPWFDIVHQSNKTAWCVHTETIGHNPNDHTGHDYTIHPIHPIHPITPIIRLNNAYGKNHGTIPPPDQYPNFARRCANFVTASKGIEYIVIGNEIGLEWEWPTDQPLTLATYADCYRQCYDAIKQVAPHIKIAPAAPAPWNINVPDAQDWIQQLATMLNMLSLPEGSRIDWICLHAYTRGYDPSSFTTRTKMDNPQYSHRYSGWETLWEYMQIIPQPFRHLPVIITEVNGNQPWPQANTGWISAMYDQIDHWNTQPGNQQIWAACLFRWLPDDQQWSMAHSPGAAEDFRHALSKGYQRRATTTAPQPATTLKAGDLAQITASTINVREAPSLQAAISLKLTHGETFTVQAIYTTDNLIWLQGPHGWCAEVAPNGTRLIEKSTATDRAAIIQRLAAEYQVDEQLASAVIAVESDGQAFGSDGRTIIRFEPHVLLQQFTSLFQRHFRFGEPQWEGHQYRPPNSDWKEFHGNQTAEYNAQQLANQIAQTAALNATSYGLGQIMGFNHAACGYPTPQAMIDAFQSSEEAQLRAMFEFFKNRKDQTGQSCLDYLRANNLLAFATLYNGPGQAPHYATLIKQQLT